jgi:hypothetical protein
VSDGGNHADHAAGGLSLGHDPAKIGNLQTEPVGIIQVTRIQTIDRNHQNGALRADGSRQCESEDEKFQSRLCANINPRMDVRMTTEIPQHVGAFQLPDVPHAVGAKIEVLVERHG